MKLHLLPSALVLTLISFASLPVPANGFILGLLRRLDPLGFFGRLIRRDFLRIEILDGVGLPTSFDIMPVGGKIRNFAQLSKQTNINVGLNIIDGVFGRFGDLLEAFKEDEEKPLSKTIPVEAVRSLTVREIFIHSINNVIKVDANSPDPTDGYLYFGNRDFKKILPMLCQSNPFFASALTVSEDGEYLELKAFADHPERDGEPLYLSLVRELVDDAHRINVKLSKSMEIVEISKFDDGKAIIVPEKEWDYYASGVIYNLIFYSSTVHANIHILHYLMCTCIVNATRKTNASMAKWANIYDDNIAMKYFQVAALLFEANALGRPFPPNTSADEKMVSGINGFGATPKIMGKVKDMQVLWGSLKNTEDFTKKFLLKGVYMTAQSEEAAEEILKEANILVEYNKHRDNVPKFAKELSDVMKEDDPAAFEKTNDNIKAFMANCGEGVSSIDDISSWLQLMSLTGIVHGSTLSYTRLILVPEIIRWRNIHSPTWNDDDISLMRGGFGTVEGMTLDRHVFTNEIKYGWKWDTQDIAPKVKAVLDKYSDMALKLKKDYQAELETRSDLRDYGWILTDHCPDGVDGKQHTITTYI